MNNSITDTAEGAINVGMELVDGGLVNAPTNSKPARKSFQYETLLKRIGGMISGDISPRNGENRWQAVERLLEEAGHPISGFAEEFAGEERGD